MTVMASFSSWQGVKMHGNKSLLTDVLKGRMGFDGFVVGDWNGHGQVPGCSNENCAATFNAGLDMAMAPDSWKGLYENTLAQARSRRDPDGAHRRCGAPHPARQASASACSSRSRARGKARPA